MMSDSVGKELLIKFLKYVGSFLGPTILMMLLYQMFDPFALRDGQFIVVFLFSIPVGVILLVGLFVSDVAKKRNKSGALPLILSGSVVIALSVGLASYISSHGMPPWFMSPFLFGIAYMVVGGIHLIRRN
jgi:hypothetical protein